MFLKLVAFLPLIINKNDTAAIVLDKCFLVVCSDLIYKLMCMKTMNDPPPCPPSPSACCGNGCTPCVNDIYEKELELWKERQDKKAGDDQNHQVDSFLNENAYTDFECMEVIQVTPTTRIFRFSLGNKRGVLGHSAGQHLLVREVVNGEAITRQFSILSCPGQRGEFSLCVKLYKNGKMSEAISKWRQGTVVQCRGPYGLYKYNPNMYDRLVLLAQGTGVVPFISILEMVLSNQEEEGKVVLLYSVSSWEEVLCKEEINEFCGYWNFQCKIYVGDDEAVPLVRVPQREVVWGRMVVEKLGTDVFGDVGVSRQILVCGSKKYQQEICDSLSHIFDCDRHQIVRF